MKTTLEKESWDTGVQYLKGVGEKLASLLAQGGIETLWDLFLTLPRSFEDRRKFFSFREVFDQVDRNTVVLGKARIIQYLPRFGGAGRRWIEAIAEMEHADAAGGPSQQIHFTWFNDYGGGIQKRYPPMTSVIFRGKVQSYRGALQIVHPDLQDAHAPLPPWEFGGWMPIYREVGGISTRTLRKILALALERPEFRRLPEALPRELCERLALPAFSESLRELHFPKKWEPRSVGGELLFEGPYFKRVVFEELFLMALALHLRRAEWKLDTRRGQVPECRLAKTTLEKWQAALPFKLTGDQQAALDEIATDMSLTQERIPMHRLVQGDVGSGKTIVAFLAALAAIDAGFQVALMAPTEILADQHHANFVKLFPERAAQVRLLKGSLKVKEKKSAREAIASGERRFAIGTQALLADATLFEKLGLIIVDEQHRFGVEQRLSLKAQDRKWMPHLLVMTATPIPRSLALTLYGDLSVSLIREKPAGRKAIRTHLLKERARGALSERLKLFLAEGRQIYIVYPLVEESEELDLKDVKNAFAEWSQLMVGTSVGLLHGRMKSSEKEKAMTAFKQGETRVLVSTTVIEVGVDVPNASVIVIEHAERFGLSQLHQLRGRVGRGSEQSFCILVGPNNPSPTVEARLKIMEQSEDGFMIAEKDLEIRGPGEFLGRRQSGLPGFRVAHILRDIEIMETAREEARRLLDQDPKLEKSENAGLKKILQHWWAGRLDLTLSG